MAVAKLPKYCKNCGKKCSDCGKINCKKLYIDLHDVDSGLNYRPEQIENITKFMVKSKYHRKLMGAIPDDKILVIGNGISLETHTPAIIGTVKTNI